MADAVAASNVHQGFTCLAPCQSLLPLMRIELLRTSEARAAIFGALAALAGPGAARRRHGPAWRPNNPFRWISVIEFNMNAKPADRETVTFDYGIPAELFMGKRTGGPRQPLRYRRFATAAEAIRFAVEELPAVRALGAWMQVGDQRFDGDDIQRLYESDDYPLQRRPSD